MPEAKRPLKVFLSYASQDRSLVRELSRRLVGEGWIDTWVDEKSLLPGQDWRVKIEEAVEEADVVIICLSNHSVSKEGHVQKELRYAREIALEKPDETIFLIPLRLDECEVPRGLRFYQWVDYFGDAKNNSYDALVKSLKLRYEQKLRLEEIEHSREEQARLEAEKLARQKAEKEKVEREAAEKLAQEKVEKEIQRRFEKSIKKVKHDLWWGKLKNGINYRLELLRIYRAPILISLIGLIIIISLSIDLYNKFPETHQVASSTLTSVVTPSDLTVPLDDIKLTDTPFFTPDVVPTRFFTPIATSFSPEIRDAKDVIMRFVPEGLFLMGNDNTSVDEAPSHNVYLGDFYIDKYEVSNRQYRDCVDDSVCSIPKNWGSFTRDNYYGHSQYDNYPVIYVDWFQAKAFCEWRGAELPTEAQWEKAARGGDGRAYPWGEHIDCSKANYAGCLGDTTAVDQYEDGVSPYGVYNMIGNVWEWVADWYSIDYYKKGPLTNPLGPDFGKYRILRGGDADTKVTYLRISYRSGDVPNASLNPVGFRCARSAP